MTTTAISGQGSTLQINTGTGSAVNITAASQSAPCILTLASGTGLAIGSVGTIAGVAGMTQLNGNKYSVDYINGAKIALAGVDSTGFTAYTSGGTWTPVTSTKIGNLKTFGGLDGSTQTLDASNLDSIAMEYIAGLKDEGTFTFDCDYDVADAGQTALDAARAAGALKTFTLTLPNARVAVFNGIVVKFGKAGGVSQIVKGTCEVRISGAVTWS